MATPASAQITTLMFDDAEDLAGDVESEWQASAEFGLLYTTGNTDTESLKAKLNLAKDYVQWRHKGMVDYYRAEQTDQSTDEQILTADRLFLSAQSNYKFDADSKSSIFVFGSYEEDQFSGYEYQGTVAVGYGARYRYSETLYADYEAGPGYSVDKPLIDGIPQESESSPILRLAGNLNWDISKTSRFTALAATEVGEDNTRSRAEVSVSANINEALALKVSVGATHNSFVADSMVEKLDTETAVTIVYTF